MSIAKLIYVDINLREGVKFLLFIWFIFLHEWLLILVSIITSIFSFLFLTMSKLSLNSLCVSCDKVKVNETCRVCEALINTFNKVVAYKYALDQT